MTKAPERPEMRDPDFLLREVVNFTRNRWERLDSQSRASFLCGVEEALGEFRAPHVAELEERIRLLEDIVLSAIALKINLEHGIQNSSLDALDRDLAAYNRKFGGVSVHSPGGAENLGQNPESQAQPAKVRPGRRLGLPDGGDDKTRKRQT